MGQVRRYAGRARNVEQGKLGDVGVDLERSGGGAGGVSSREKDSERPAAARGNRRDQKEKKGFGVRPNKGSIPPCTRTGHA